MTDTRGDRHNRRLPLFTRILYAPLGALLWLMSLLPLGILYLFADLLGFVAFHIVRYRRKLVRRNLSDCFPDLSIKQLRRIEKGFYRRLGSYFVETVKMLTISDRQLHRRMTFVDAGLVDKYLREGRDIVIYTSHLGNWEWITSFSLWSEMRGRAEFAHVYRPLKNRWFDAWWLRLRGQFNKSLPMHSVLRSLLSWRREGIPWITGFLSDQKPSHAGKSVEVQFLGRKTPFIYGTEELARKLNAVVMLFDTDASVRGHYSSTIRLVTDNPSSLPEGEITRIYAENLTGQIRRAPEAYLWSHNRWKLPRREL